MSQRSKNIVFLRRVGVAAAIAAIAAAAGWLAGFRWNETESLPPGLWRISGAGGEAIKGRIAFFCPPATPAVLEAKERGYMREGRCNGVEHLFKPIVAVAGDVVEVADDGIRVNGLEIPNSKPMRADGAGRAMPQLERGTRVVEAGQAWAVSSYTALSFDSRYIGPIDVASIDGQADPIWITESER